MKLEISQRFLARHCSWTITYSLKFDILFPLENSTCFYAGMPHYIKKICFWESKKNTRELFEASNNFFKTNFFRNFSKKNLERILFKFSKNSRNYSSGNFPSSSKNFSSTRMENWFWNSLTVFFRNSFIAWNEFSEISYKMYPGVFSRFKLIKDFRRKTFITFDKLTKLKRTICQHSAFPSKIPSLQKFSSFTLLNGEKNKS